MKRGTVMLIQRGDAEITGAIVAGIAAGRETTSSDLAALGHLSAGLPAPSRCNLSTGQIAGHSTPLKGEARGALTGEQIEVVEAEIDRQKILADLVRVATNNSNTPEDYQIMITKARGDYQRLTRPAGPIRRLARRALGLYGLIVYSVATMGRG